MGFQPVTRAQPLTASQWLKAISLWNDGYDTADIAKHFTVPESWIYNGLSARRTRNKREVAA
jgi:hypothetical protein